MPMAVLYFIFNGMIGFVMTLSLGHAADKVVKRLGKAFPNCSHTDIKSMTKNHFKIMGWFTAEFIKDLSPVSKPAPEALKITNPGLLQKRAGENKILICYSGHFYNFELLTGLAKLCPDCDFAMLYSSMGKYSLTEMIVRHKRQRSGAHLLASHSMMSLARLAKEYRDGLHGDRSLIIGVLADPKASRHDCCVDFLGESRPAFTGMEKLAELLKARCLYASPEMLERGEMSYTFFDLVNSGPSAGEYPLTRQFYSYLQDDVAKWPEGWMLWGED